MEHKLQNPNILIVCHGGIGLAFFIADAAAFMAGRVLAATDFIEAEPFMADFIEICKEC